MLWFNDNDKFYFTHIPRTGGRYVSSLLLCNNYYRKEYSDICFRLKEVMHLTYNEAIEYNKLNTLPNHFTIIRNPVNKFISATKFFDNHKILKNLESKDFFKHFMNELELSISYYDKTHAILFKGAKNFNNNWFEHQNKFINDHTKIWKFENKLENDFIKWLNNYICKINYKDYNKNLYKIKNYDNNPSLKLTKSLKSNIENYYKDDMDIWENL